MRTFVRLVVVSSLALVPVLPMAVPAQAVCDEPHDVEFRWRPIKFCANYPILEHDI